MMRYRHYVIELLTTYSGADPSSVPIYGEQDFHSEVLRLLCAAANDVPTSTDYSTAVLELLQKLGGTGIYPVIGTSQWRAAVLTMLAEISGADASTLPVRSQAEWEAEVLRHLGVMAEGSSGTETTVTGVSPLALASALAKPIKELIQYGACEQASSPSPSSPQSIVINNGALTMVDDELPAGYKRVKDITYDGDFYYDTGEVLTGNDDVTMTLTDTKTTGQNVFGSYNGTASGVKNLSLYLYGGGSTSNCYLRYGEQLLRPRYGSGKKTITFGKSGTSGFTTDVTAEAETFTTTASAYIGMLPNSTSPAYSGTIVGDISVGTRLRWIPCERLSDNAIGYYEVVNGKFIEPTGTGTPSTSGYDTSHITELAVVGTAETLEVASQTADVADLYGIGSSYQDEHEIITGAVARKCGIIVYDGTENWKYGTASGIPQAIIAAPADAITANGSYSLVCSHFIGDGLTTAGHCSLVNVSFQSLHSFYFRFTDSSVGSKEAVAAWVAAQYAAGTPLTVIYPLNTAAAESADAQPLATEAGDNTITVTSNLSSVSLKATYIKENDE